MKSIFIGMASCLFVIVAAIPTAWSDDDLMIERFGISRSEPIYAGYVFVDGRYINAPYVIELRGIKLFLNGHDFGFAINRDSITPGPYDTPLHEDPGMPDDIDENTSLGEIFDHPVTRRKQQYWATIELRGDEYRQKFIEYYKALPCVAEVKGGGDEFSKGVVVLIHHGGHSVRVHMPKKNEVTRLRRFASDSAIMMRLMNAWQRTARELKSSQAMLVCSGDGKSVWREKPREGWSPILETLAGDLPMEEKIARLHGLGFLKDHERPRAKDVLGGLLTDFQTSSQLRKRMAGDESWVEEARNGHDPAPSGLAVLPSFVAELKPAPKTAAPTKDLGEDRWGWRRGEPTANGYVFVDGRYLDPPYVVEQRGTGLFVNSHLCESARLVQPGDDVNDAAELFRLRSVQDRVESGLRENGFAVVEGQKLQALHDRSWTENWWAGLSPYLLEYTRTAEDTVRELPALFLSDYLEGGTNRNVRMSGRAWREFLLAGWDDAVKRAVERYGRFLGDLEFTPGFWIRLAGGDIWEQWLSENQPEGPFGVIRPPSLPLPATPPEP